MIILPKITDALADYCIYTGKHWPKDKLSDEHPIPLSVGGNNSDFVIAAHKKYNNKLGAKVDQPVVRDPIIMFGRRDSDARGHHGHQHAPIPKFKNARAYCPQAGHKSISDGPNGFKLEMTTPNPRVTHQPSKTVLPSNIFRDVGFVTEIRRDDVALCRFGVKAFLGICWRLFLTELEDAIDTNALRYALNPKNELTQPAPGDIRFIWEREGLDKNMSEYLDLLKSTMIRKGKSTVMLCEHNGRFEFAVSCVGYFVSALQIPIKKSLLIPDLTEGQRMVITFERNSYLVELGSTAPISPELKPNLTSGQI